jgi:cell cycle protein kinase DBF2
MTYLVSISLVAHSSVRYSSFGDLSKHPFFKYVKWDDLHAVRAPFVPALDSEIDTGYYDDFSSPEDMAK